MSVSNVYIDDTGIICHLVEGDATFDDFSIGIEQLNKLSLKQRKERRPVLWFIDFTNMGKQTSSARKVAVKALNDFDYDKIAITAGNNLLNKHLIRLVIKAFEKSNVKYFDKKEDALDWLKE